MKPIIYTSPLSSLHNTGEGHPENAKRIEALEALFDSPDFADWEVRHAQAADLDDVLQVHDEGYIFNLQDKTPEAGLFNLDGDTVLSPQSYDAALHSAGAVCQAIDDVVVKQQSHAAFCAVRPPGHHAEPEKAMGFCLMNNVFIGALYAQKVSNKNKVAIIDFDVHHGNGTESMTRKHNKANPEKPVFYASSHGYPLFPMTGDPKENNEYVVNVHLPERCDSQNFRELYETHIFPALEEYNPDVLILSSGFDAHKDDPLAQACLLSEDYAWITKKLSNIVSNKNIISVLEGGYDVPSLTESVKQHLKGLNHA